jgi:hypothetical protein
MSQYCVEAASLESCLRMHAFLFEEAVAWQRDLHAIPALGAEISQLSSVHHYME